jgi:hypothetical protein
MLRWLDQDANIILDHAADVIAAVMFRPRNAHAGHRR